MIRLNKFFMAKGAGQNPQSDAEQVHIANEDPAFGLQLRQAIDRSAVPDSTDLIATDSEPWPAAEMAKIADLPIPPPNRSTGETAPRGIIPPQERLASAAARVVPMPVVLPPAAPPSATPVTVATVTPPNAEPVDLSKIHVAQPDVTGGRRAGRVRTRLLGYDAMQRLNADPIDTARAVAPPDRARFPVGWLVVTKGPGRGAFFALFSGVSQIGREEDQGIRLDFGDTSISRSNHAAVAYDDETNGFFVGHGGKANIVRLNDRPVVSTERLKHQDVIRIGETTLLFVALCTAGFRWTDDSQAEEGDYSD